MDIIALLAFFVGLAYFNMPGKIARLLLFLSLILYTWLSAHSWFFLCFLWLIFLPPMLIFSSTTIRRFLITPYILRWFQKSLPPINDTEREALEAGDVHWEKELFCGRPNWEKLDEMPISTLTSEESDFLANQVEKLCEMLHDWEIVHVQKDLPPTVWKYLKKEGFFGLQISKEYGGHGFSVWAHSHIITKIASRSVSTAITVMVPNSLGPADFLQRFGTDKQKRYYLPRLAKGEEIPAFALTGLEAGSDATAIPDTGIVCRGVYEGKEVIGLKLNWTKRYITLAPVATVLGIAFKMYDPEHLLGAQQSLGITLALIPTHLVGVEIGAKHSPLGLAFLNGPTRGYDVFIPLDCIIGGVEMVGKGWRIMMESLAQGRGISLPALSTAAAKLSYRMTGAYAQLREQFHLPLGQFEGIAEALGRIGGLTYIAEATRHFTLGSIAQNMKPALGAAITKYQLTEIGRQVVNDAMDIHGGHGIQLGPQNYLGLLHQSLPIAITVEGANIMTRNLIIFGQGAMRCHPFIKDEINTTHISDPKERLARFDMLFCKHVGYTLHQFVRVFSYGLTGGLLIRTPSYPLKGAKKYIQQLTRMSAALAFTADLTFIVLGKKLKRREAISARLGDVLSQLYLASAVIKYAQSKSSEAEETIFVQWALSRSLHQIQEALDDALFNFSPRWLGVVVHRLVFPWGRAYKKPADRDAQAIAACMMKNSPQRDRITQYCYVGKDANDATGRVELALTMYEKVQAIYVARSVNEKLDVFSAEELAVLREFSVLREKALRVDEF